MHCHIQRFDEPGGVLRGWSESDRNESNLADSIKPGSAWAAALSTFS